MKKYSVSYCSGATGYGWKQEYDRLDEFESFIKEMRNEYTCEISVFDHELGDFIYWKRALCYEPEVNVMFNLFRDLRTTTRRMK